MSQVRESILNALVTELDGIDAVKIATRETKSLDRAEEDNPYIGVVAGPERVLVQDATDIKFEMIVHLFIITEQQYENIEGLIVDIKEAIYGTVSPINLNANIDLITIIDVLPVLLEDFDDDRIASNKMDIRILYNAPRSTF